MNKRHRTTLAQIFEKPVRANIEWKRIESLFTALGAEIEEGAGSRVWVFYCDRYAVFHWPHPKKEAGKKTIEFVRDFLINAGITPKKGGKP